MMTTYLVTKYCPNGALQAYVLNKRIPISSDLVSTTPFIVSKFYWILQSLQHNCP